MARPGNRRCANCIGTLSFPIEYDTPLTVTPSSERHVDLLRTLIDDRHGELGRIQNESVPIQLAQCWFPVLAISIAKIKMFIFFK